MMDNRAQSVGIARFFLALGGGAVVYWIVDQVTTPLVSHAENATNNATANTATTWFSTGIDYMPIMFMLISFFGIIIVSIYQRERLR